MRTRCVLVVILGTLILAMVGCGQAAEKPPVATEGPAPAAKEKPQYGGIFRTTPTNPRIGQDPHKTTGSGFTSNFGQAYSALLTYKFSPELTESDLIVAPDLAERWENPDPKTWIFYLKKGVKWQNLPPVNGREFVADDVVYNINRMKSPGTATAGYWLDVVKVEAVDKYTVKISLKAPSAAFLTIAAYSFNLMVAKEVVESVGGDLKDGPTIGTGPWIVVQCTPDVGCDLKRNPDYHQKDADGNQLPYLDGMKNIFMPDSGAKIAAFRAKQLDTFSATVEEQQIIGRAHPEVVFEEVKGFSAYMIHTRNDRPPWSDERVRMAVSKAMDRQAIINNLYAGKGWLQWGWLNPGADWFLPQEEFNREWKQDIPLAKKLLAEAGYPNGFNASMNFITNYGPTFQASAEVIVADLAKVGIRVKLKPIELAIYLSRDFIRDGQFEDMSYGGQGTFMDPDLWLSAYYHSDGGRNSDYTRDPELDKLIEVQRRELNPEKRKAVVQEIQRYLFKKNYQQVVFSNISMQAQWPWVKNRSKAATGDYPLGRWKTHAWFDRELQKKLGGDK